jgi:hypothetical protein
MIAFLTQNLATIIISALLVGVVVGIIVGLIKKKKSGKGGCSCGCDSCPSASSCREKPRTGA